MSEQTITVNEGNPKILTIGGGKGGVGKSVIAANLAVALALDSNRVIIVDADLGAANLHAILGIRLLSFGLKDFIFNNYPLKDILVNTDVNNLRLISGAGDMPGISNIPYRIKQKLINQLKTLQTDYIIIDLAPGVNYNNIDLFNTADAGILITTTDVTSIMAIYTYIKMALHRRLLNTFKNNTRVKKTIETSFLNLRDISELKDKVSKIDDKYMEMINDAINIFYPKIIVNRIRNSKYSDTGESIVTLINKRLGVKIRNLGYVVESRAVEKSIKDMKPFIIGDPDDKASKCIREIVSQISNSYITASDS